MSSIEGIVLDAAGQPVAQARVYFTSVPGAVPDVAVLTGSDGRFRLSAPRPGAYEIGARSDALGAGAAAVVVGATNPLVEIRLAR